MNDATAWSLVILAAFATYWQFDTFTQAVPPPNERTARMLPNRKHQPRLRVPAAEDHLGPDPWGARSLPITSLERDIQIRKLINRSERLAYWAMGCSLLSTACSIYLLILLGG